MSGRHAIKRHEFQQFVEDARTDTYDVLLVDHTSRFGRNQEECIRFKSELQRLGKIVVFVSQGIISGSDRDFLSERINETLDEQYSRNLSRYVSAGLAEKAAAGHSNGLPPLGYKSLLISGKRERKVPDPDTMPVLLSLLRDYAAGAHSFRQVADRLNAQGFKTREGNPFTGYSVRDILSNRYDIGKVIYHEGRTDEQVLEGSHEVPAEVRDLWERCQEIKAERTWMVAGEGRPRGPNRHFPFARVLRCHRCARPYHGEARLRASGTELRLTHERRTGEGRTRGETCTRLPRSQSVDALSEQFAARVLPYIQLDDGWKVDIIAALGSGTPQPDHKPEQERSERALQNIRKQHQWGHISDDDYLRDRAAIERQLKALLDDARPQELPNLERAAAFLNDLPALWAHPGVGDQQREELLREVFTKITIDGKTFTAIEPKPVYIPLFAVMASAQKVDYQESIPSPTPRPFIPGAASRSRP